MKLSDWLPKVLADGEGSDVEITTKKYSEFPVTDGEGIQGVGLKDGKNVRFDLTTDSIKVNPTQFRNRSGQFIATPEELANLKNQRDVNELLYNSILDIEAGGGDVDLSEYATTEYVDETELNVLNAAVKVANDGDKVLQDQIDTLEAPDLTGYATETYVDDSIAAIEFPEGTDLSGYAKEDWVTEQIDAIDLPETDLDGYATEDYVDGAISGVESIIPDVDGLATENYVDDAIGGIVHPTYDDSGIKKDLSDEAAARVAGDNTLQTEITELALALDTLLVRKTHGQWKYVGFMGDVMARNPGEFALGSDDLSASNNVIQLNNTDLNGLTVGTGDISAGDYVELVEVNNPDNYVLFVVAGEPSGSGITEIGVTLKEKGNNFLVNATCEIRFFELNDQSVDLSELDDRYARKDHTHPEFTELQGEVDYINEWIDSLEPPDISVEPPEGDFDYRRKLGHLYCAEAMRTSGSSNSCYIYNDGTGDLTTATHFDINRGLYLVDGETTEFTEWDEKLEQGEWLNFFIPAEYSKSGNDQYVDIQVGPYVEKINGANGFDAFRFEVMSIRGTPAFATLDSSGRMSDYRRVEMNYGLPPSAFVTPDQLNASIDGVLDVSKKGDAELQSQIDFMKQELNTIVPIKDEGVWRMYANYNAGNCMPTNGNTSAMVPGEFSEVGRFYWANGYLDASGKDFTETITDKESVGMKFELFLDKDNWGLYQCTRVYESGSKTYWDVTCLKSSGSYKSNDMPKFEFFEEEAELPRTIMEEMAGHYLYTIAKIADQINVNNIHEHPGRLICLDGDGNVMDAQYGDVKVIHFSPVDANGNRPPCIQQTRSSFSHDCWEVTTRIVKNNLVVPSFQYHPRSWDKRFTVGQTYNQAAQNIPTIKFHPVDSVAYKSELTGAQQWWRWPV